MNSNIDKFFNIRTISILNLLDKNGALEVKDIYKSLTKYFQWYQAVRNVVQHLESTGDIEIIQKMCYLTETGKQRLIVLKRELTLFLE